MPPLLRPVILCLLTALAGCGLGGTAPDAPARGAGGADPQVRPLTADSLATVNATPHSPRARPDPLARLAALAVAAPPPVRPPSRTGPAGKQPATAPGAAGPLRLPPPVPDLPYALGVGDVLLIAFAGAAPGTAQPERREYTVRDGGAISLPRAGLVRVAGMTLEEADAAVFDALVAAQADPEFSLDVAAFNARRVSVAGAVRRPGVLPITLTPLFLGEALAAAGGVTVAPGGGGTVRLFRGDAVYPIPLAAFSDRPALYRLRLVDGDTIRVTAVEGEAVPRPGPADANPAAADGIIPAAAAPAQAGRVGEDPGGALRRLIAARGLDGPGEAPRDYVYLATDMDGSRRRIALPYGRRSSLADVLSVSVPKLTTGRRYRAREFPGLATGKRSRAGTDPDLTSGWGCQADAVSGWSSEGVSGRHDCQADLRSETSDPAHAQIADSPALVFSRNCEKIGLLAAPMLRAFSPMVPAATRGGIRPRVSWLTR